MRHCVNDSPAVYEHESKYLAPLLEHIADWLYANDDEIDGAWTNLHISSTQEDDGSPLFRAALYVH